MNGNWGFQGNNGPDSPVMGASFTTTSGKVIGSILLLINGNGNCIGSYYDVRGTLSSTGAVNLSGQGISISGTLTNGVFSGSWSSAACSPSGTTPLPLDGYPVGSLVGTWKGQAMEGSQSFPLTADISSESYASFSPGQANLEGVLNVTAQIANSPCLPSIPLPSYQATVIGPSLSATLQTNNGSLLILGTVAPGGNIITGTFSVESGDCAGNSGTITLTRS